MNYLTNSSTPLSTSHDQNPIFLADPSQLSDYQKLLSQYRGHSSSPSSSELDPKTNQLPESYQFHYHGKENAEYALGEPVDWREYNDRSRRTFTNNLTDDSQEFISTHDSFDQKAGWEARYSTQYHSDSEILPGVRITTDASLEANAKLLAYARGAYGVSLSSNGFRGQLQAEAGAGAEASVNARFNSSIDVLDLITAGGNANGQAAAFSGSKASGDALVGLGLDGIYGGASGKAFAGMKAQANGNLGFSINGQQVAQIHGGAEAQLGVGVSGTYELGLQDGKLRFKIGAGLALGIGLEFSLEGSINVKFFTDLASDVIDLGENLITDPIGSIGSLGEGAWDLGTSIADGLYSLGTDVAEVLWDNGSQLVSDGVEQVGELISDGVEFVGDAIDGITEGAETAIESVGELASEGGELIAEGAGEVIDTVGQGLEAAAEFAGGAVSTVGNAFKKLKFW
jgi:hypothetical protein